MKKTVKVLSLLMVICMLFGSCAQSRVEVADAVVSDNEETTVLDNVISNPDVTVDSNTQNTQNTQTTQTNDNACVNTASSVGDCYYARQYGLCGNTYNGCGF